MRLGVLCSGGKDSWAACHRAMAKEEVACLVSLRPENEESYLFHTPNTHLVPLQAEAAGLPLVSVDTPGIENEELADLARAVGIAKDRHGIEGIVTGALESVYQAARVQKVCRDLGLWCFNPLWYTEPERYLQGLIRDGFSAVVSGVASEPFTADWLGRRIDEPALADLRKFAARYRITLTGEGGEYETLVLDAPAFRKRIVIEDTEKEFAGFRGVLRVRSARLEAK
jgi:ABC transporter with metal-binding/Fe-S-binding domain ATP-binding protein